MTHQKEQNSYKTRLLIAIGSLGLIVFFLIASTAPLKDLTLKTLFPKSFSRAQEINKAPKVNLRIAGRDIINERVVNVSKSDFPITLIWTTSGNPNSCTARSFGLVASDDLWSGTKNPQGGSYTINELSTNNPYVYTIDCSNKDGDADGSSVTINVGAQDLTNSPYFSNFNLYLGDKQYTPTEALGVNVGDKVVVSWNSLNTSTPYSICISSGSWPKGYKSVRNFRSTEELSIPASKVYKYTIYCSNEHSFTQNSSVIIAN